MAGAPRRPRRLPPLRRPPGHRPRPHRADAVVDAPSPAAVRDAPDLAGRRRHQLRDARARPADARLRRDAGCSGDDRGPPGRRRREDHDPRRRPARARPRRRPRHRRLRPDRARRDHGRRQHRGRRRTTADVLLEAATWDAPSVARAARRHRLPSEAARRFEREVDPAVARGRDRPRRLAARELRRRHGRRPASPTRAACPRPRRCSWPLDLPDRVAGVRYERGRGGAAAEPDRLRRRGRGADPAAAARPVVRATPPTWRPDLTRPADLVEEVLRLEGYDGIPSELPAARARHRAHARAAPPPPGVAGAGRRRVRRGAAVAVRRAVGVRRAGSRRRRPAPPRAAPGEPARRRPRADGHDAAARPARRRGPQRLARPAGPRALPDRPGRAARRRRPDRGPGAAGGRPARRRGVRDRARGPARPAAAGGRGARRGRGTGPAGGVPGAPRTGRTRSRRHAWSARCTARS